MNKKLNTFLFVIGATVFNIIVMIVIMILGLALLSALFGGDLSQGMAQILFLLLFVASIAGAFGLYHLVIHMIARKIDMEKYFHPIFGRRKK